MPQMMFRDALRAALLEEIYEAKGIPCIVRTLQVHPTHAPGSRQSSLMAKSRCVEGWKA